MNLEKVIKYLDKNFKLPDPRIWKTDKLSRIYYNHPKYKNSFVFVELGSEIIVSDYDDDDYWRKIFGMKSKHLRRFILEIDKIKDTIISNYYAITREPPVFRAYRILYSEYVDNLADDLSRLTNANWIYANYRLICDRNVNQIKLDKIIESLSEKYRELTRLVKLNNYPPRPIDTAKWFATFINNRIDRSKYICTYNLIDNKPVIEFNTISNLTETDKINKYEQKIQVGDITSKLRGYISHQTGIIKNERQRLLALTSRKNMQEIILNANDDERVLAIKVGNRIYDYPESALYVVNSEIKDIPDILEKFDFIRRITSATHPKIFIKNEMLDISKEMNIKYFIKIKENEAELYKNNNFVIKKDLMSVIDLIQGQFAVIITEGYITNVRNTLSKNNEKLGYIEIYHEGLLNRNGIHAKRGDIMRISKNEYLVMLDRTIKIKYFNISGIDAIKSILKIY